MGMKQGTIRSNVAGVGYAPSLKDRMDSARKEGFVLKIASFAAAIIPGIGVAISYLLDRKRSNRIHNSQMDVLAEYYRFQVAATLGMNPEKVRTHDLNLAAKINPALAQAVNKIHQERKSANRSATMSNAAIWAVSGANMIPFAGLVGKIVTDMAAGAVGGAASSIFDKDILYVTDIVEYLDDKIKKGEQVTKEDIIMLNAARDEDWQARFKGTYGKAFHKMSTEWQSQVIASMPHLMDGAQVTADGLNRGVISPQSLTGVNYGGGIVRSMRRGSFVDAEMARRAQSQEQAQIRA